MIHLNISKMAERISLLSEILQEDEEGKVKSMWHKVGSAWASIAPLKTSSSKNDNLRRYFVRIRKTKCEFKGISWARKKHRIISVIKTDPKGFYMDFTVEGIL